MHLRKGFTWFGAKLGNSTLEELGTNTKLLNKITWNLEIVGDVFMTFKRELIKMTFVNIVDGIYTIGTIVFILKLQKTWENKKTLRILILKLILVLLRGYK